MICSNCQELGHNSRFCKTSHKSNPVVHRAKRRGRPPIRPIKEDEVQEAQLEVHNVDQFDAGIGPSSGPPIPPHSFVSRTQHSAPVNQVISLI